MNFGNFLLYQIIFLLCTVDVMGLYPNIPHEEGLQAIRAALEKREDKTVSTRSLGTG